MPKNPHEEPRVEMPAPRWIDVSVPLRNGLVPWPGDPPFRLERVSDVRRGVHVGDGGAQKQGESGIVHGILGSVGELAREEPSDKTKRAARGRLVSFTLVDGGSTHRTHGYPALCAGHAEHSTS